MRGLGIALMIASGLLGLGFTGFFVAAFAVQAVARYAWGV